MIRKSTIKKYILRNLTLDCHRVNTAVRNFEINRLLQVLRTKQRKVPVLIGAYGAGRFSTIRGLARRIVGGEVPSFLVKTSFLLFDFNRFIDDCSDFFELISKCHRFLDILKRAVDKNFVLILRNFGLSSEDETRDIRDDKLEMHLIRVLLDNIRKSNRPYGKQFHCILTCEDKVFEESICVDSYLLRNTTSIRIPPLSYSQTTTLLRLEEGAAGIWHPCGDTDVLLPQPVIKEALRFTQLYIGDGVFPKKVVDILDDICAFALLRSMERPKVEQSFSVAQKRTKYLSSILKSIYIPTYLANLSIMETALSRETKCKTLNTFFGRKLSSKYFFEIKKWLTLNIPILQSRKKRFPTFIEHLFLEAGRVKLQEVWDRTKVSREAVGQELAVASLVDITTIISEKTGTPVAQLTIDESKRLLNLEKILHERVIGQNYAISQVVRAIRRARVGLKNPQRPIASFIFAGTTGVGKTELAKAIAERFFGKKEALLRFDMSEFMSKTSISRLIGSPPGYVGYDEGGQLTDKVKKAPYSLILFDEVEKAHPDVFNLLLQVLEDGQLTDSQGNKVRFSDTLIIFTTNLGAKEISQYSNLFNTTISPEEDLKNYENLKKIIFSVLENHFRPEFLNRLDDTIVFSPLTKIEVRQIADLMLDQIKKRLATQDIELTITSAFKDLLLEEGYDPTYGARPLRRALSRLLEDKIAAKLLTSTSIRSLIARVDTAGSVILEKYP